MVAAPDPAIQLDWFRFESVNNEAQAPGADYLGIEKIKSNSTIKHQINNQQSD